MLSNPWPRRWIYSELFVELIALLWRSCWWSWIKLVAKPPIYSENIYLSIFPCVVNPTSMRSARLGVKHICCAPRGRFTIYHRLIFGRDLWLGLVLCVNNSTGCYRLGVVTITTENSNKPLSLVSEKVDPTCGETMNIFKLLIFNTLMGEANTISTSLYKHFSKRSGKLWLMSYEWHCKMKVNVTRKRLKLLFVGLLFSRVDSKMSIIERRQEIWIMIFFFFFALKKR